MKIKNIAFIALASAALVLPSCQREYVNPNSAQRDLVLNSTDGLLGYAAGIRREYSVGATSAHYSSIICAGHSARELYVINTGNGELAALEGGNVGPANSFITNLWTSSNLVRHYSDELIQNAGNANDPNVANGLRVYGHFFKALAIGTMSQFFEQVTTEFVSGKDYLQNNKRSTFKPRADALREAISLLEAAETLWGGISAANRTSFITRVGMTTTNNIDFTNAIPALIARYANMLGDNDKAIAATNRVNLASRSIFVYEAANPNRIRLDLATNNVFGGNTAFGLSGALAVEANDGRTTFHLGSTSLSRVTSFYTADASPIPVYLPSEMTLIRAEAFARKSQLDSAIANLNRVRTKTTAADPFGIGANLPIYTGVNSQVPILQEIYRNRCIELFMSGMKLEDSRRFGRPGPRDASPERNRNFYPYPQNERENNSNTPADPSI